MFFRRKLNHDKPLRSPIAFYDLRLSPSNLVFALMFFHEIWSKAYVFLVLLCIVDGDIDNNICTHVDLPQSS